jgi:hypothetical protein
MRLEGELMVEIHYYIMEEVVEWDQVEFTELRIRKVPAT